MGNLIQSSRNQPRLLVVDDERNISDTLGQIFALNGYEVRIAYSGEQAAEMIAEWQPLVAIVDIVLPKMNGIDLAFLLCSQYPEARVLLLTGQTMASDLMGSAEQNGLKFKVLPKPIHPEVILEEVARLLLANSESNVPL
jgi:DNA-binding NtrC family response regulator